MAYEDFSTWTEVDEDGDITLTTSNKITVDTMLGDAVSYVRKDGGAGYYGDFSMDLTFTRTATTATNHAIYEPILIITNKATPTFFGVAYGDADSGLIVYMTTYNKIAIQDLTQSGNPVYSISKGLNLNQTYYLSIERSGTILKCYVYSDSARTQYECTPLEIPVPTTAWRYLAVASSVGATAGWNPTMMALSFSGIIENLEIKYSSSKSSSHSSSSSSHSVGSLLHKHPTGDAGTVGTWAYYGTGVTSYWEAVDDEPDAIDSNTTYIVCSSAGGGRISFSFPEFQESLYGDIYGVKVYYTAAQTSGSTTTSNLCPFISVMTTPGDTGTAIRYYGEYRGLASYWTTYSYTWHTNPYTGLPWTLADFNDNTNAIYLFGVSSTDASPALAVTFLYMEVEYESTSSSHSSSSHSSSSHSSSSHSSSSRSSSHSSSSHSSSSHSSSSHSSSSSSSRSSLASSSHSSSSHSSSSHSSSSHSSSSHSSRSSSHSSSSHSSSSHSSSSRSSSHSSSSHSSSSHSSSSRSSSHSSSSHSSSSHSSSSSAQSSHSSSSSSTSSSSHSSSSHSSSSRSSSHSSSSHSSSSRSSSHSSVSSSHSSSSSTSSSHSSLSSSSSSQLFDPVVEGGCPFCGNLLYWE